MITPAFLLLLLLLLLVVVLMVAVRVSLEDVGGVPKQGHKHV
jgi:hypothetical protein